MSAEATLRLEALNVSFATHDTQVRAVRDLSLAVAPGECLGVVGESGAGKSQAFLAVLGLLAANGRASGHAYFADRNLIGLTSAQLDAVRGSRIGTIFQDPMTSLTPHLRIGEQIAEPLVHHQGCSWGQARRKALELLDQVHVTDVQRRMKQYPHELSGGMRQRVGIAIALACEPALLIADEPTTALDVTIQAQILSLLAELKRTRGMAMILITHDLGAVAGIADRVAVMQAGSLVELDTVRTILKAPRHPYTRGLLNSLPSLEASAETIAVAEAPVRLQVSDLEVQFNVRTGYLGTPAVLRAVQAVELELRAGEALGVVGESGSGKSTLARAVVRLLPSHSGRIAWLGKPVEGVPARELRPLRRETQIIFQDPLASLDPRMTAAESIAEALRTHQPRLQQAQRLQAVSAAMLRVGLAPELRNRYPHELSGGQCQRVGIARALVLQPRVLVCDEPVSALDVTVQQQIVSLLAALKREEGLSILFISHNLAVIRQLCDRVLVLYLGRMMELSPAASLYAQPLHPYTRELMASAPVADPDVQPERLRRALIGEPPSPLAPPSGCVYRTRCPHATEICHERVPEWQESGSPQRRVACHRWRELAPLLSQGR
ncbi:MAG TPA: dipeptide ABC transporter ATP-binding protein [Steroidobacteraceae bacterium]